VRALAVLVLALALAGPAAAACPTVSDLEDELVCPTCQTTLDQSSSPVADRMRAVIRDRVEACVPKQRIKDELVAEFGPRVLAEPQKEGFELLAWALPLGGVLLAAALVGYGAWRWSRLRDDEPAPAAAAAASNGRAPLPAELERRLDDELARFDA
jgi:cytochrome c-type biogenesis protein CcmH